MNRGRRAWAVLLALAMLTVLLTGCGPKIDVTKYSQPVAGEQSVSADAAPTELAYANGTILRMATG